MLDGTETATVKILSLYTTLIRSWTASLMATASRAMEPGPDSTETITVLISHCSALVSQLLTSGPSSIAQTAIHEHLQTITDGSFLALENPRLKVDIPPSHQTYLTIFTSPTIYTLSSSSNVLSKYKDILEAHLSGQHNTKTALSSRSSIADFNGYMMDFCNLFWRNRAFNTAENNAKGCLLSRNITKALQQYVESIPVDRRYSLGALSSLSFHPALSAVSIQVFRDMEDKVMADNSDEEDVITKRHAGPVTQHSLAHLLSQGGLEVSWLNYRREVLDVLGTMGADGLSDLIRRSVKLP